MGSDNAPPESSAVLVFASDDPSPGVFPTLDHAYGYMEFIDVQDGGYESVWTASGRVVAIEIGATDFTLRPTDQVDPAGLRDRLGQAAVRSGVEHRAWGDPLAFANEEFEWQFNRRWPKRPRWLSRRLHGEGPIRA